MKSSAKNISLNSYDNIFTTEEARSDEKREKVMEIPLAELYPFPDHPFQVRDDDAMRETVESVKEYGVLVPAIARPRADGGYELISGHRRKRACELAGFLPCRSLSAIWTMMPLRSSWLIATYNVKISCRANGQRHIK